jgi:hypothetical protein
MPTTQDGQPQDATRIEPRPAGADDKDWTWVLTAACNECDFVAADLAGAAIPTLITDAATRWQRVLARLDSASRPAPEVWSPLEYGCHTRDVFEVFTGRLTLMLTQDSPTFANWDQDDTAVNNRYWAQESSAVAEQIDRAAVRCATAFARVTAGQWSRPGLRSNGSVFTVLTLGRYFSHDVVHHLWDVHG